MDNQSTQNQSTQNKNNDVQNNRRPDSKAVSQSKANNGQAGNGQDKKVPIRIGGNNKNRGQSNGQNQAAAAKGKDPQKAVDKPAAENQMREKNEHRHSQQGRYPRNNNRSSHHESSNRPVRAKREETLEDIQADIEQIEKDIQFEIKQIKSIKLGL